MSTEHNNKIEKIFHKALYWKAAAFGTLCIQQEYQLYEQLAKDRFFDMSVHLKKAVNRFWKAVTTGYAIDDKYLLIIEESFFEPRDEWEKMALQIVQDIQDLYYAVWKKDAKKTLETGKRQLALLEKYCVLMGEKYSMEHPQVKRVMEQQINLAEELVAVTKQDKKEYLAALQKREVETLIDADIAAIRPVMPKEKKAKKQIPELRYMSRYIEEGLEKCIEEFKSEKEENTGATVAERYENKTEVDEYYWKIASYEYLARMTYVAEQDKVKTLEYYYLAACAARDCIRALREGKRAISWNENHINCALEDENSLHYFVKAALLAGHYDIALEIVTEDSVIGAMLLGEDERAKKYLPGDFEQINKYDRDWDGVLWAILHRDEKLMNTCIKEYIKTLRWQAKNFNSNTLIAVFSLPLIRLAMDRGMKCNLNVYELPLELLERKAEAE